MQRKYSELKQQNDQLLKKIDNFQQELDKLNMKKAQLEEVLRIGLQDEHVCEVSLVF